MKRGNDLYPHKPSPGHTLDEVLKSLRDLIRNDLPAGLADTSSPPADTAPAPTESGIDAPPPPAPDPSSGELVNEVLAGLERELAELDDLDPPGARPSGHESVLETEAPAETPDEIAAAAPPADPDQPFTEEDVRHAIEDQADDEPVAGEGQEQGAAELPDDDFPEDDFPEDDFPDAAEPAAIAAEAEAFTVAEAMPADILEPEAEQEIPAETDTGSVTEPEPEIERSPEPGSRPDSEVELEVSAPPTEPMGMPPAPLRMPAAAPPTRLRDSLALIAPGREESDEEWSRRAFVAPPAIAQPEWPDEATAPVPESDAIPLLDDAIESGLPPDFAVRVRAIAIQAAARLEHEMRRAGRTPIATDLVPALARILEEALAQEFARRQNDGFGENDK